MMSSCRDSKNDECRVICFEGAGMVGVLLLSEGAEVDAGSMVTAGLGDGVSVVVDDTGESEAGAGLCDRDGNGDEFGDPDCEFAVEPRRDDA